MLGTSTEISTNYSSAVITNYGSFISLYYLVRGIDTLGTGKATFCVSQAAELLKRSERSINRYLEKCVSHGLFTQVFRHNSTISVYYASHNKVAANRGLDTLGTTFRLVCSDYKTIYRVAVLAVAEHKQKVSKYKANFALPKSIKKFQKAIDSNKIQQKLQKHSGKFISPSLISQGVKETGFALSGKYIFIDTDVSVAITLTGVSLQGIAKGVARHFSSVGRNLRKYSDKDYFRTAYTNEEVKLEYIMAQEGMSVYPLSRFVVIDGIPFLRYTNFYLLDGIAGYAPTRSIRIKANYKQYLNKVKTINTSLVNSNSTDSNTNINLLYKVNSISKIDTQDN